MYEYLFFSNNLAPFRLYRLMTNAKKMLLTPILDINLDDANAVPPVAIKSSTIKTLSCFFNEQSCISI